MAATCPRLVLAPPPAGWVLLVAAEAAAAASSAAPATVDTAVGTSSHPQRSWW